MQIIKKTGLLPIFYIAFLFLFPRTITGQEQKTGDEVSSAENAENIEESKSDPAEKYFNKVKRDLFLNAYLQRIKFRIGYDYSRVQPFVLEENKKSWMINSIAYSAVNPELPPSLPISSPDYVPVSGNKLSLEYSYRNRLHIELYRSNLGQEMRREDPTTVNFINPGNSRYYTSAFEGVRLLGYRNRHTMLRAEYIHPFFSWFRAGLSLRNDEIVERNKFSFGSYNLTRSDAPDPLLLTWSIGGDTDQVFRIRGVTPGIVARFQPYDWLEFIVRTDLVSRDGTFELSGFQVLEQSQKGVPGRRYYASASAFRGKVKEMGTERRWEAVFHFCRLSIHAGFEEIKLKRRYVTYVGNNVANITGVSFKTNGVGIGELSQDFKHGRTTFFIEPSISFFF